MHINTLAANIKNLDLTIKPATSDAERDYFRHYGINFEEHYEHITHHFGHFASGRFDIVAHFFDNKNALGTCFIVHGYYDHSGLYGHLIDYCLKRNLSVVIFDLPGHGLSTGDAVSISSFAEYQLALNDVLSVFSAAAPQPWHAVGQSTGAAILMDFLLSGNTAMFSKTVLLAPLVRPEKWMISVASYNVAKWFLKRVRRHFSSNSHDQQFLDFLRNNDPLQARHLPLQWVGALKKWIDYFIHLPSADCAPLIVQGKRDTTVDWRYNIPVVQGKFPRAKAFYLKEGQHHLVNESQEIRAPMFSAMDVYFDTFTSDT